MKMELFGASFRKPHIPQFSVALYGICFSPDPIWGGKVIEVYRHCDCCDYKGLGGEQVTLGDLLDPDIRWHSWIGVGVLEGSAFIPTLGVTLLGDENPGQFELELYKQYENRMAAAESRESQSDLFSEF